MTSETIAINHREKRSVSLSKPERSSLKKFSNGYKTKVDCAAAIGIDRNVLDRVLLSGSGSPSTIERIKAAIVCEVPKIA